MAAPLNVGEREINLTQVLKLANLAENGGQAKAMIADGLVRVNGQVETRKRRQMGVGDYSATPYLPIALGAGDTTVQRMVNAFATFANQGRALTPTLIDYIQDRNGHVIWRADTRPCEGSFRRPPPRLRVWSHSRARIQLSSPAAQ